MKKVLLLVMVLVLTLMPVLPASADSAELPELPESVCLEVTGPVEGGPAYFPQVIVSGGTTIDGIYRGWCIDIDTPITPGVQYCGALVYSSYETLPVGLVDYPENFDLVNWILNQNYIGQTSTGCGGTYTYGDVQAAIWTLLDGGLPPNLNSLNTWLQCRTDEIISDATANGEGYQPGCGEDVCVILAVPGAQALIIQLEIECREPCNDPGDPYDTEVQVASGGGEIPVVKCKWEQQPVNGVAAGEDGDITHITPGFQILPPLKAGATKTICYYAVVTDGEDMGDVAQVFADVYHPMFSPMPYGNEVTGGILDLPYFKYEIPFSIYNGDNWAMMAAVEAAYDAGLISFNPDYDLAEVLYELEKGTAKLWTGCAEIDYEQPAGNYDVYVFAIDTNNNFSNPLFNQFLYVPVCGIEVDFSGIAWGSSNLGVEKMIPGDTIWDDPAVINHATVRNIGNTWTHVTVEFDDMGFGKNVNGDWNVQFDARMGSDNAYYVGNIMPNTRIVLPNALGLSMKDELDFSIMILKGTGEHQGTITLGCDNSDIYPFVDPVPENIVGFDATVDY